MRGSARLGRVGLAAGFLGVSCVSYVFGELRQDLPPEGRQHTDRSIVMRVIVDAPPAMVFQLWSTPEGTRRFFGADARIELREGGAYEIYFLPEGHPQREPNSTKGCRLLRLEPDRGLTFEWRVPPFAPELDVTPPPTWVEVGIEALEGQPDRSDVRVAHHGFGRGASWDRAYEFFVRGWASILYRLDRVCAGADPGSFRNLE